MDQCEAASDNDNTFLCTRSKRTKLTAKTWCNLYQLRCKLRLCHENSITLSTSVPVQIVAK